MPYTKGQSGNPKGRPPKGRALAEILTTSLNSKTENGKGQIIPRKKIMSELLAQAVSEGKITFPDGREIYITDVQEYYTIAKFTHTHLDGPVRPEIDVGGNGVINFTLSVRDTPVEADEDDGEDEDAEGN